MQFSKKTRFLTKINKIFCNSCVSKKGWSYTKYKNIQPIKCLKIT